MKNTLTIIFIFGVFCVLLSLGFWQLDRLEWKTAIINDIKAQESVDPMTLQLDLSSDKEFQRGYVDGYFLPERPIKLVPRTLNSKVGYHMLAPFKTISGHVILVNYGWVADARAELPLFLEMHNTIAGYIKKPDQKNSFTPKNNPKQNLWYWLDINALEKTYDVSLMKRVFYIEAPISSEPQTFDGLPKPRNKHAQYAYFWFGMSGLLLLLSALFYWKNRNNKQS